MKKIHFETIDSTNNLAKEMIRSGDFEHGTLITADMQTGGRGRNNRVFASTGGMYMSLLLDARNIYFPITPAAAVATAKTVAETSNLSLSIKWVNDLIYAGKKVCGILTEAVTDENGSLKGFVCGIGLNTENTVLPDSLKDIAAYLPISKDGLAEKIASSLLDYYENNIDILPMYKEKLLLNIPVDVYQNDVFLFSGIATDINENGNLIVKTENETRVLTSGEISIKLS